LLCVYVMCLHSIIIFSLTDFSISNLYIWSNICLFFFFSRNSPNWSSNTWRRSHPKSSSFHTSGRLSTILQTYTLTLQKLYFSLSAADSWWVG